MTDEAQLQGAELRLHLQKLRDQYFAFLGTDAHDHYVRSRREEVVSIANNIVALDPVDRAAEIESLKLRGDMRTTEEFISLFEDTLSRLEERIEQLLEAEHPTETAES